MNISFDTKFTPKPSFTIQPFLWQPDITSGSNPVSELYTNKLGLLQFTQPLPLSLCVRSANILGMIQSRELIGLKTLLIIQELLSRMGNTLESLVSYSPRDYTNQNQVIY